MMRIYAFLIVACVALLALPVQAAERTISVNGLGTATAKPDTVEIRVGVVASEVSAGAAIVAVSDKASAVIAALVSYGIAEKDIQTGSVSLNPVYQRRQNNDGQEPRVIGYRAAIDNRVRVHKLDALGKILDSLSKAGVDRLDSIRFFVADTHALQAQARTKAVKDAMTKAKQLSDAAGIDLGDVMSVTDGGSAGNPAPQQRLMAFASAERGVPVMPGEVNVKARVHMVFAIK
jgi:uncharacterized protein